MVCKICCNNYTHKLRKKFKCEKCLETACSLCVSKYAEMEKFGCVYCGCEILLEDYRFFVSDSRFKKLSKLDLKRKFAKEIPLLKETARIVEMEKKFRSVELLVNWMRVDGVSEEKIFESLKNAGLLTIVTDTDELIETIVNSCSECGGSLKDFENGFKKCVNCEAVACEKCTNAISDPRDSHSCDFTKMREAQTNLLNWRLCPECTVPIEKDSGGCDQMFCVLCKTTFSWRTGKRASEEEVKHNPHFYQWQREQTTMADRNPLDNPCEGHFLIKCQEMKETTNAGDDLGEYLKLVQTMMMNSLESFVQVRERDEFIRQQFRVLYLTKKYDETQWKIKFSQQLETLKRNSEMQKILLIALDSMYQIVLEDSEKADLLTKLENLFEIVTESLHTIQKRCRKPLSYSIEINAINLPYQHHRQRI
jgi:hypothetical protein